MRRLSALVASLLLTGLAAPAAGAQVAAYQRLSLSFPERAADLVSRMTFAEKAAQLATTNAPAIPRLGVQEYAYWSEAQHGVSAFWGGNSYAEAEREPALPTIATSFPTNLSASMTWDPALMRRESAAISDEARGFLDPARFRVAQNNLGPRPSAYGSLFYFNPTVNMARDPRWGRSDEAFGEDPFLTGVMGSAYVQGFQGEDARGRPRGRYLKAVATAKHFALNNVEDRRTAVSSDVDEATIRDYYTPQFRRVVEQGGVGGVMSSYNAVNGTPAVANTLLLNVLGRRTFGFDGYVTSDCGGVATTYRRADPPPDSFEAAFDLHGHDWAPPGWSTDHAGERALWTRAQDGASISGKAGGQAFALRSGGDLTCSGDDGDPTAGPGIGATLAPVTGGENTAAHLSEAIATGALSEDVIDTALARVFTLRMRTGEFDPRSRQPYTRIRSSVIQSAAHRRLAQDVAERSLVLLKNAAPRGAREPLLPADPRRLSRVVVLGAQADEVFLGGYSGAPDEQISLRRGLREQLPGATVTFDAAGASPSATAPVELAEATREAIRTADLVVVMVGTDASTSGEGFDRHSLALPGNYDSLVERVAAVGNPRVALVVQAGAMVELGAAEKRVAAILFSGPNGQRQGRAAARVLLGRAAPAGHLSFTWYRNAAQVPPMANYNLTPQRTGGLGRTYQFTTRTPAYPFGFGLSYTRFRWSGAGLDRDRVGANGRVRVRVRVTNTGPRRGSEVVQIYARGPGQGRDRTPRRRLVGFARTRSLAPGGSERVSIPVSVAEDLRHWDTDRGRSRVSPGRWTLEVARAAGRPVRQLRLRVRGSLARTIRTLTVQAPASTLRVGQVLALRGANPWLEGLAPVGTEPRAARILAGVREDDAFADLRRARIAFRSSDARVLTVDRAGNVRGRAAGVATVTLETGGARARVVLAVR